MRKNKLVWVVRDEFGDVEVNPTDRPSKDNYGYWDSLGSVALCYSFFKKATGLSLKVDEPIRVRFSAEIYKP